MVHIVVPICQPRHLNEPFFEQKNSIFMFKSPSVKSQLRACTLRFNNSALSKKFTVNTPTTLQVTDNLFSTPPSGFHTHILMIMFYDFSPDIEGSESLLFSYHVVPGKLIRLDSIESGQHEATMAGVGYQVSA